jgi:hypothetical protein
VICRNAKSIGSADIADNVGSIPITRSIQRFTRQRMTTALVQALCVDADGFLSLQETPGRRSVTCE